MSHDERLENVPVAQLIRWWRDEERPDWATALFRDKVASALSRLVPEGVCFLKTEAENGGRVERFFALSYLSRKEIADEEICSLLVRAFRRHANDERINDERIMDAAFKVVALGGFVKIERYPLDRGEVESLLRLSQTREEEELAASALLYLSHAHTEERAELLRSGLHSPNAVMRGRACEEVGVNELHELSACVLRLTNDADEYVSRSARNCMDYLETLRRWRERYGHERA